MEPTSAKEKYILNNETYIDNNYTFEYTFYSYSIYYPNLEGLTVDDILASDDPPKDIYLYHDYIYNTDK